MLERELLMDLKEWFIWVICAENPRRVESKN
jgi:hypothetical protein